VRSIPRTSCHYGRVLRLQLEEEEVGVRWLPACEDVSPVAEERPLLEAATKQRLVKTVTENTSLCVIVICEVCVVTSCVLKYQMNPITNPNPVYSHTCHVTILYHTQS
jgi:hypothetical protein